MSHHDELVEKAKEAIRAVADDLSAPNGERLFNLDALMEEIRLERNRILNAKGR